jgi:hypothetical protein
MSKKQKQNTYTGEVRTGSNFWHTANRCRKISNLSELFGLFFGLFEEIFVAIFEATVLRAHTRHVVRGVDKNLKVLSKRVK